MSDAGLQADAEGVVRLSGVVDFESAGALRDGFQQAAASGQGPLVLDMSQVTQANSVGLSLILRAAEHCQQQGRQLQLRAVPAGLQSIARVCGLDAWLVEAERAQAN
ncbi:STAS domain-containing protein [Halopseudomonas sp.]|uniref:STAS domain-containing protein n=1 Tax=Halopseudomonas sp. TaxID=2901191 RepID=UPI00311FDDE7